VLDDRAQHIVLGVASGNDIGMWLSLGFASTQSWCMVCDRAGDDSHRERHIAELGETAEAILTAWALGGRPRDICMQFLGYSPEANSVKREFWRRLAHAD